MAGCQPVETKIDVEPTTIEPTIVVELPEKVDELGPRLIWSDRPLYFGASEDDAFQVFKRPRGAYDFFESPPIKGDNYAARGWQSAKETFAGIFLKNRLVLGQYVVEGADEATFANIINQHRMELSPMVPMEVPSSAGTFWFWQKGPSRLMIGVSVDGKKEREMIMAVGDITVMDGLRMSPDAVRQDLFTANQVLTGNDKENP